MKVGILGAGNVGGNIGKLCKDAGLDVVIGSRSGDVSLAAAAEHGEIVIVAVHYHVAESVLSNLTDQLTGKIVVDATNPLNDDWSPLLLGEETSAGEEMAKLLPESSVVKAFNTVFADIMTADGLSRSNIPATTFVAGDAKEAVAQVADLALTIGFHPEKLHKLSAARHLEALAHLNIQLAVGEGGGTNAAILYHRG